MDLDEFSRLKKPHLLTLCFCVACLCSVGGYGLYILSTGRINTSRSDCVCNTDKTDAVKDNGAPEHKAIEQFISPGGDILCGPQAIRK